jgi:ubiquinone/menaquinone biosynthesis C-methylase UbiE
MRPPSAHTVYDWEIPPSPQPLPPAEPSPDRDEAERLAAREIWRIGAASKPPGGDLEPLSTEWFHFLDSKRYRRHGRWVPALLEFTRHANDQVFALGDGLGIDWVRFAESGANVSVVDPSSDRIRLYKQHFSARAVAGQFLHAPFDHLPAADKAVDVVSAVFNERPATPWPDLVAEAERILRPGGKFIAVVPAQFNADRLLDVHRPWRVWRSARANSSARFTARVLRESVSAFQDVSIHKRHLRRSELPYLWRWVVLPLAERLMGRYLVVKAFKPLKAATPLVRAAA